MHTLRLFIDPASFDPAYIDPSTDFSSVTGNAFEPIRTAAGILQRGGTVAFATETVYGLGANALDPDAVAKIFAAKQRPAWDPLIVHIADEPMLVQVAATVPPAARRLMERFWPGPLTLLLPRATAVPDAVAAGRPTVGVRMPAHPVARALIRGAGVPIAAPSANTFGHVSPTTAAHVAADLDGRIDAILDSGETLYGLESTVLDTCADPCLVYRPGAISLEQLRAVWPATDAYRERAQDAHTEAAALASPGLGMRHYAPRAELVLVELDALQRAVEQARSAGVRIGVMLPVGVEIDGLGADATYDWGRWSHPDELAHRLFAGLRRLDAQGVDKILCPLPRAQGLGVAIVDRLRKAARRS